MQVKLLNYPTDADWWRVKQDALVTMGLDPVKAPTKEWKHQMLVQRHSPIRTLMIRFRLIDCPYWLSTQFSRHVHAQPYIKSQRNDRRSKKDSDDDRNARRQDSPVDMIWEFNAESFLTCANKRLCHLATKQAQRTMHAMCALLETQCPEFKGVLVPMCRYHGNKCHEANGCGLRPYDGMTD